jgi:glycosyltransferase involved in cell wall biosynthesis
MRYAWEMEKQYLDDFRVPKFLRRRIRAQLSRLRKWDLTTAKRVDVFLANSTETQRRIKRIYGRESTVIPPPVGDAFFTHPAVPVTSRDAYLAVGRLVPYKRTDLLIRVASERKLRLKIAGTGQEETRLRAMAGPTVEFLGYIPDAEMPALYAQSRAVLFPALEDAGIVPLEAQASGTPVVALGKGGALDTVIDGKTGIFFAEQAPESLGAAIDRFQKSTFEPETIRAHARRFSEARFGVALREAIEGAAQQLSKTSF